MYDAVHVYGTRDGTYYLPRLYPCTLPTAPVQGVSASDLPTKSISLIPTKDQGTNLFD